MIPDWRAWRLQKRTSSHWRGYNCFSSAVGTAMARMGCRDRSLALDSGFDFFFNRGAPWSINSTGIWPGSEHPTVSANLRVLYGIRVQIDESLAWPEVIDEMLRSHRADAPLVLALSNQACPYVPRRDWRGTLPHYVVASMRGGRCHLIDTFLGWRMESSPEALMDACTFRLSDGREVSNRVCRLRLEAGELEGGPGGLCRQRAASRTFLLSRTEDVLGSEEGFSFGAEAIRGLADFLSSQSGGFGREDLQCLQEAFRYVMYQRNCFRRYLKLLAEIFQEEKGILDELEQIVCRAEDAWLNARLVAGYLARTKAGGAPDRLIRILPALALLEEEVVTGLERLRYRIHGERD